MYNDLNKKLRGLETIVSMLLRGLLSVKGANRSDCFVNFFYQRRKKKVLCKYMFQVAKKCDVRKTSLRQISES